MISFSWANLFPPALVFKKHRPPRPPLWVCFSVLRVLPLEELDAVPDVARSVESGSPSGVHPSRAERRKNQGRERSGAGEPVRSPKRTSLWPETQPGADVRLVWGRFGVTAELTDRRVTIWESICWGGRSYHRDASLWGMLRRHASPKSNIPTLHKLDTFKKENSPTDRQTDSLTHRLTH